MLGDPADSGPVAGAPGSNGGAGAGGGAANAGNAGISGSAGNATGASANSGGNSTAGGSASTAGTGGTGGASSGNTTGGSTDTRVVCNDKTHGAVSQGRRLTLAEYNNVITDVLKVTPSTQYPSSYGNPATGYSTEPAINDVGERGVEQVMNAAEDVALLLPAQLTKLLPCSSTAANANATCAGTYLDTVGKRLYRRTLTAAERTGLLAIFTAEVADGAAFADAVSVMTAQILQEPAFLYLVEQPSTKGVDRALSGLELANRLSFFFWSSGPDDELLTLAEKGGLTGDAVATQAKRLFDDARSERGFVRFFREWTGANKLTLTSKDAAAFPGLNQKLIDSVNGSFDKFAVDQVRSTRTLHELLRANTMFVDKNLATYYGLDPVSAWTNVTLPADRYSGIVTQPGVMASLAHTTDTSFVFRGKFIRKRVLCQNLGSPPPDAMTKFAAIVKPENPTGRETAAAIESRPECAGCHALLDPAGLVFEHLDAMGKYRAQYTSGKAIDTAGTLVAAGPSSVTFTNPADMMEALADLDATQNCFSTQVFRYTASRMETSDDVCAIQAINDAIEAASGHVADAFLAATQTDTFRYRRGE